MAATVRLDKWLWYARFFKTRTLSAKVVTSGHVRVNSQKILKVSYAVKAGDTLTFAQGDIIRVATILDVGTRRGPASEAQALYEDLTPPAPPKVEKEIIPATPKFEGKGRPTKKDRRALDPFQKREL